MSKNTLLNDFLSFAGAANKRSTVDLKDGLKPVHRRILYTLNDYKKGYTGSNKVVGEVLGSYHPAGDTSIYGAAVRLAQPFKTRYPLIDFEGNRGTVADPSGYASSRYTKMKLSDLGKEVLTGIEKDTVPFTENYDGSLMEPVYMPGLVPITLINGALSIGVGMASSIPPHNLREVANAITYLIDNPDAETKDLMHYIKGPDFPTGGTIGNPDALLEAYETGSGSVRIQANYALETKSGHTHIVIKEVPFLVDPNTKIIGPIKEMYSEGYEYIEDIEIQTGKGIPFQLDIKLTKDAPVFAVVEEILKSASVESSYTINLTTHVGDNKFQRQNLKGLLNSYIEQNIVRLVKAAEFDKTKAEDRLLIVEALIKAQTQIDEVVKIIRNSENTEAAHQKLMELLIINSTQSKAILAMRLSQLTKLDVSKLKNEKIALSETIRELKTFISSRDLQLGQIKTDIKELSRKFGDPRRTRIQEIAEAGEVQDVSVFLTDENEIFVQPTDVLPENRRNTKGKRGENLISVLETKSDATIWVAAADGIMYPVAVASLTISNDVIKNTADNFGVSAKAVMLIKPEQKDNIITITEEGIIKRSALSDYNVEGSFRLCKLREDDSLSKVFLLNDDERIIMLLHNKKYVAFKVEEVRKTGTNTIGTKLSSYKVIAVAPEDDYIIFADADGNGKKILSKDVQTSGRKTNGLACNDSIYLTSAKEGQSVYIFGDTGHMIRIPMRAVNKNASPTTKGVALYNGIIGKMLTK